MKIEITSIENDPSVSEWEEVPDEDLWEDGELSLLDVFHKIEHKLLVEGDWKLIKRKD
tara:strand:- start:2972 stop:3145 length:174 start_codon:yes stop_codon:yes gene_type:complete